MKFLCQLEAKKDSRFTQFDNIGEDGLSDDDGSEEDGDSMVYETPTWLKTSTIDQKIQNKNKERIPNGSQLGLFLELLQYQNASE